MHNNYVYMVNMVEIRIFINLTINMQKCFSVKVFLTSIYMAFAYVYQSFHVVQEFRSYQSTHLIIIENSKLENFSEVSIFVELNARLT